MTIKKILNLSVVTESGSKLGVVRDVECDVESHMIRTYIVGHKMLGTDKYHIVPSQIKAITLEKMVVKDGVLPEQNTTHFKTKTSTPQLAVSIEKK